jgi:nicotinamide-nucleotide amidase
MSTPEEAIHAFLVEKKKTLALAESCTGGRIAAQLTALPGASAYFLGSLVVYSDLLKQKLLSVPADLLKTKGAVSKEVVAAMLEGLFKATGADYGLAVTGIAGPTGGTPELPIGTIWAALGERGKPPQIVHFRVPSGGREMVILGTTNRLLGSLWQYLKKAS